MKKKTSPRKKPNARPQAPKGNGIIRQEPIDIEQFESKVIVRQLRVTDYEEIVELQRLCFPGMLVWREEQLRSQISIFPEGQLGVEYDGKLVASSSSLIVDFEEYDTAVGWSEISDSGYITNHDTEGDSLYGIEIMVHPEFRGKKLARRLYDARKNLARQLNLRRIVIGGRLPGYKNHADQMTAREYVEFVMNRSLTDPVLTVQTANGFVLKRILPKYLSSDLESQGYATFLEWINLDYNPRGAKKIVYSKSVRISLVQYQLRAIKNFSDFAAQCEYFVDVASNYKSDFVVFPELFTMQLLSFVNARTPARAMRKLASFTPQYIELFSGLSIKYNLNIVAGTHFTLENEVLRNISYLFMRDGTIGRQYKLHVTPSERRWWGVQPGNELEIFQTDKGKVAILICYDVEFPELCRIAVERGADVIFVPFCTDDRQAYLRVRYCSQARAIENQVYVCAAGTVGNLPFVDNMDIHYAQSGIFTPSDFSFPRDGIAAEASPNVEMVVVNDVDLALIKRTRTRGSVTNWNDRRKELYSRLMVADQSLLPAE